MNSVSILIKCICKGNTSLIIWILIYYFFFHLAKKAFLRSKVLNLTKPAFSSKFLSIQLFKETNEFYSKQNFFFFFLIVDYTSCIICYSPRVVLLLFPISLLSFAQCNGHDLFGEIRQWKIYRTMPEVQTPWRKFGTKKRHRLIDLYTKTARHAERTAIKRVVIFSSYRIEQYRGR